MPTLWRHHQRRSPEDAPSHSVWSQSANHVDVRCGSNSEVIADFEDVRFDTESGNPQKLPSHPQSISPSRHLVLRRRRARRLANPRSRWSGLKCRQLANSEEFIGAVTSSCALGTD